MDHELRVFLFDFMEIIEVYQLSLQGLRRLIK
jgi:hypothetical protein